MALDIDKDGQEEIIVGTREKFLYCLNATTGQPVWKRKANLEYQGHFASADFDKDGKPEIAIISPVDIKEHLTEKVPGYVYFSIVS